MISHTYRLASGFYLLTLGEELQWYHTLGSLQVVFSIHVKEGKKMVLHTCKPTSGFTTYAKTLGTYVNWWVNFITIITIN